MKVEFIKDWRALVGLKSQWKSVYRADPEATYYLSHEWLFGTNETIGKGGFVIGVRETDANSDFVAFLPIRLTTKRDDNGFYNELSLIGNSVSDYNGFICKQEFEEQAILAIADMLNRMNWRRFQIRFTPISDRRLEIFLKAFSGEVLELETLGQLDENGIDNGICPYTKLPDDWDTYLSQNVSSNTRQKIRRFLRQVESSDSFRFTHATAETLERDIDILNKFWSERWGEIKGKDLPTIVDTTRRTIRSGFNTNTLFFPILWQGDRPLCALGIFVDREKKVYNFHIGGRDTNFQGPPTLGMVCHAYAIRHAISQGIQKYDFLRGNEPYKYSFCSEEQHLKSMMLVTKSGLNLGGKLERDSLRYVWDNSLRLYRRGELQAAKRGFSQILKSDPNQPFVMYRYGYTLAQLGLHSTAYRVFLKALLRNPDSPKLWLRMGRSLISRNVASSGEILSQLQEFARILTNVDLEERANSLSQTGLQLSPTDARVLAQLIEGIRDRDLGFMNEWTTRLAEKWKQEATAETQPHNQTEVDSRKSDDPPVNPRDNKRLANDSARAPFDAENCRQNTETALETVMSASIQAKNWQPKRPA